MYMFKNDIGNYFFIKIISNDITCQQRQSSKEKGKKKNYYNILKFIICYIFIIFLNIVLNRDEIILNVLL